jgi:hypothetical protein
LLQTAWRLRTCKGIDDYWTLTGYFNAIRELAGARALFRQDIPERLGLIGASDPRPLSEERVQELSSRTSSTQLPAVLETLNVEYPDAQDALFTTSMFGTGIDIPRIGLMVVHGQPKTTSSYIQATGRVGRRRGALVVVFLRATRPRDLNHYEFFCGFHCQLDRFVEPVTVMPFAPGAVERACGPVAVFMLRNMRCSGVPWHRDDSASRMVTARHSPDVKSVSRLFRDRAAQQPAWRASVAGDVELRLEAALDDWSRIAALCGGTLRYVEYGCPESPVVLGDPQHQHAGLMTVYRNAPQSLREVEETCGIQA